MRNGISFWFSHHSMIESKLRRGKQRPDHLADGNRFVAAIFQVGNRRLTIATGCRARKNRPAHFVGDQSTVIKLGEAGDKVIAGGLEPTINDGAVAEEEGL